MVPNNLRLRLLLVVLAVAAGSARVFAAPLAASKQDELQAYAESEMKALGLQALSFAIADRSGVVLARGFGRTASGSASGSASASGQVSADTPFLIGSLSKSMTALAIAQLSDAHQLELDAPVQRYIPWFRVRDANASARMTVRHLLQQTSGLPANQGFWDGPSGADALEQRVRALSDVKLSSQPGTKFEYSNANYEVLGLLVQVVSGTAYADYMQRNIFAPLKMTHSFTDLAAARRDGLEAGHKDWFGVLVRTRDISRPPTIAAGGLISSAGDMARYLAVHLNGGELDGSRVLSAQTISELHRPSDLAGSTYAMGWSARRIGDEPVLLHNGSTPEFSATMLICETQGIGVVVLTDSAALPVPLTEPATRHIATGLFRIARGEPAHRAGFRARFGLLAFKWVVLGSLGFGLWNLVRRKVPAWQARKSTSGRRYAESAVDAAVVLGLIFGVPWLFHAPLGFIISTAPDFGLLILAGAALSLFSLVMRLYFSRAQ